MRSGMSTFALFLLSAASPALALDFGNGFYTTGEFELEYLDGAGFSGETFAYGEADIGWEQEGGGFGAFIGFDTFALEEQEETAFYGALSYSGSFGKVQIGAPRPALDDYLETPDLGGSALFDLELSQLSGSIIPVLYLGSDTDAPLGLRYDGSFGAAKIGASYHNIDELDADVLDVAVNYQLGQVELRAGAEHINAESVSETSYFLGAEGDFGQFSAGLLYGDIGLSGGVNSLQVYGVYRPIEGLDVTATFLSLDSGGSNQDVYGLAANYTFYQGVYAEVGFLDGDLSSDQIWNASLGVKF